MPSPITLFEHETEDFDWTYRDLSILERLRNSVGAEILHFTVCHGKRVLRASQHVGVIRLGKNTIQVLPKIHRTDDPADRRQSIKEATSNLLYMLSYASELPIREHALAPLLRRNMDWFEILARLFASHLMDELRRGAVRRYEVVEDELPVLRGKWRIAEQLRHPERKHIFSVAHDEFTADNALNRVFRYVVERLWRLTGDSDNRQQLGTLRQWMQDEVTLLPSVTVSQASPALITRLNERYRPVLNLARLFLDNGALQLAAGDLTTFAFMFDMNQLFESFIINFIRRHRREILPPVLQNCDMLPQSRGEPFYLANKRLFRLQPDLVFRDDNQANKFLLLLDTKYKKLDANSRKLGVAVDDFYQMYAYAHRYNCARVLLIYPQTAEMASERHARFVLDGEDDRAIEVATVSLRVDLRTGRKLLIRELNNIIVGGDYL